MKTVLENVTEAPIVVNVIDFARSVADRVIFMDEGCVIDGAHPEELLGNPNHPRIRAFLQKLSER